MCQGEPVEATVRRSVSDEEVVAGCLLFSAYGDPLVFPNARHAIVVRLEGGTSLSIVFPHDAKEGETLTIGPLDSTNNETIGDSTTASLTDDGGFEGSPRELCADGSDGTLRLDLLATATDTGLLTSADGEASITFANCTSAELNVTDGPVALDVKF